MALSDDSDDENDFISIGTVLPPFEEGEGVKKPTPLQERSVLDGRGRAKRLHGAFTGGFSAGYYNTVGSADGWQPSNFVSSRDQHGQKNVQLQPEDFMDTEDLGEHGIAPRKVTTTDDFLSEKRKRKPAEDGAEMSSYLQNLVKPVSLPIGVRLMRKLGWKEGQGVGSKVKRRAKKSGSSRTYGCAMPTQDSEESSEDELAVGFDFAPKDICPIRFTPKDNTHGIGYSGINIQEVRSQGDSQGQGRLAITGVSGKSRRGITGKAFGVGVLHDDDDDIYGTDNMQQYDNVLDDPHSTQVNSYHGWTAPKHDQSEQKAIGYINDTLQGFQLSAVPHKAGRTYAPPTVPRHWKARHVFPQDLLPADVRMASEQATRDAERNQDNRTHPGINDKRAERALALGESPTVIGSVFDLISKDDKSRMDIAKKFIPIMPQTEPSHKEPIVTSPQPATMSHHNQSQSSLQPATTQSDTSVSNSQSEISEQTSSQSAVSKQTVNQSAATMLESLSKVSAIGGLQSFKPFLKYPEKQQRYEAFLENRNKGGDTSITGSDLTEWESSREHEEFVRAAQLYRPASGVMASRFTTAQYVEDNATIDEELTKIQQQKDNKSDMDSAVELGLMGKMTREVLEWHPDKLLCKRFNIPNPYPDSSFVGLRVVKREKYSLLNPLEIPVEMIPEPDVKPGKAQLKDEHPPQKEQPAPILSGALEFFTNEQTNKGMEPLEQSDAEQVHPIAPPVSSKPPLDLFKAIFSSSDDDSSSDESDVDLETSQKDSQNSDGPSIEPAKPEDTESASLQPPITDVAQTNTDPSVPTPDVTVPTPDVTVPPPELTVPTPVLTVPTTSRTDTAVEPTDGAELYGPPLPQGYTPGESSDSGDAGPVKHTFNLPTVKQKSNEKSNKSSKHKKSKKKKKKKLKKKLKEARRRRSSSSSSSDCVVVESTYNKSVIDERVLLDRLKSLPKGKRPSAADFM